MGVGGRINGLDVVVVEGLDVVVAAELDVVVEEVDETMDGAEDVVEEGLVRSLEVWGIFEAL